MASAIQIETTDTLAIACTSAIVEGDVVRNGFILGVATKDKVTAASGSMTNAGYFTIIKIPRTSVVRKSCVAQSTVGSAGSGSAIALGDKLYRDTASQEISKDSSGYFVGYALGTPDSICGAYDSGTQLASAATGNVDILLAFIGS